VPRSQKPNRNARSRSTNYVPDLHRTRRNDKIPFGAGIKISGLKQLRSYSARYGGMAHQWGLLAFRPDSGRKKECYGRRSERSRKVPVRHL
jgi:hypothetical protein